MKILGDLYRSGVGVPRDIKHALELYTMAFEHGNVTAINNLATMYYNGEGTERDVSKGKELLMKAATLGSVNAILSLKQIDKELGNTTPSFTPTRTHCSYCGVAHSPPKVRLNPCSGCHCVYYCSKEHQRIDWKMKINGHKEQCKKLQTLK